MDEELIENGDQRAPGVQLVPSEVVETTEGAVTGDKLAPGITTVVDPGVTPELTAKDYREAGYNVDKDLPDDAVPALIVADRHAEVRTVVLADGTQVAGDAIPTASALKSRQLAKTPEEVTAEAVAESEEGGDVAVDTHLTPVEAIEEQGKKDAKAGKKAASKDAKAK